MERQKESVRDRQRKLGRVRVGEIDGYRGKDIG